MDAPSAESTASGQPFTNLKWNGDEKPKIQSAISRKLRTISNYDDEVLQEYVTVMLQNKKTRAQVAQDLEAFLGNKSKDFAFWLWEALATYEQDGEFPVENETEMYDPLTEEHEDDHQSDKRSPAREDFKRKKSDGNGDYRSQSEESSSSRPLSSVVVRSRNDGDRRGYRSRGYDDRRYGGESRNYRRSPERQRESDRQSNEKQRDRKLNVSNSRMILSAVKAANESAQKAPVRKESNDNQDEEMEETQPRNRKRVGRRNEDSELVVRRNRRDIEMDEDTNFSRGGLRNKRKVIEAEPEEEEEEETSKKFKIRCSFWPNCTKENCPYVHPSEPCKNFPACSFGDKCLYVHPNVPCKFGAKCMRTDCAFNHPARPPVAIPIPVPTPTPAPNVPCRNGYACMRDNCIFLHPMEACKYGKGCLKGSSCPFSHAPVCKFGAACARPGCSFGHPPQQTPCKFGAACTNKLNCRFYHADVEAEKMKKLADSLPKTPPRESNELRITVDHEDAKEDVDKS